MKKQPKELDDILKSLLENFQITFGVLKPTLIEEVFDTYLLEMQRKFVRLRVDGLDALGVEYLKKKLKEPVVVVPKIEPKVEVKKEIGKVEKQVYEEKHTKATKRIRNRDSRGS